MLTEAQVAEFRESGFLLGPRVYDEAAAERLRQRLDDVIEGRAAKKPEALRNMLGGSEQVVVQVVNIWKTNNLFREHRGRPGGGAGGGRRGGRPGRRGGRGRGQDKPPE